jgi:integrative and conjugative element protein (TIGR02256 family)
MSTVLFTRQAADQIAKLAAVASDGLETGGILLGNDYGLAGPIVVRQCGDPGPQAVRRHSYFRRDLAHARTLAADAAKDGSAWIGEWHTHGMPMPEPSIRDLRTYQKLLDDPQLAFARILAVIVLVGPDASWHAPILHAWSFTGHVLRQLPVHVARWYEPVGRQSGGHEPSAPAPQSSATTATTIGESIPDSLP